MTKFKVLFKGMMDDLKDAEMMIDYACKLKDSEEDKSFSAEIAKYAKTRLEHFMVFHKMFEGEIAKEKNIGKETVQECMWKEIHEMYQDWYNDIDKKIKKY